MSRYKNAFADLGEEKMQITQIIINNFIILMN